MSLVKEHPLSALNNGMNHNFYTESITLNPKHKNILCTNWFYLAVLYSDFAVMAWNKKQSFYFAHCRTQILHVGFMGPI